MYVSDSDVCTVAGLLLAKEVQGTKVYVLYKTGNLLFFCSCIAAASGQQASTAVARLGRKGLMVIRG